MAFLLKIVDALEKRSKALMLVYVILDNDSSRFNRQLSKHKGQILILLKIADTLIFYEKVRNLVGYRQQLSMLLHSIGIWPTHISRLTPRERFQFQPGATQLDTDQHKKLVVVLLVEHQGLVLCCLAQRENSIGTTCFSTIFL